MTLASIHESEASFMGAVLDLARFRGWMVHHQRPARTGKGWRSAITGSPGWPDLAMVRDGRLILAELKSEKGRLSPDQEAWRDELRQTQAEYYVWRPSSWEDVVRTLA